MSTDGLRPAPRGRLGAPVHEQRLVRPERSVLARIDGAWCPADVIAQRQVREGGAWEICLQWRSAPGSNHEGWFVAEKRYLRAADSEDTGSRGG